MGFRITNRYTSKVSVAIMYYSPRRCGQGQWQTEGWWSIAPQGSALVYANDVNFNRYWYYHAHAQDGALWEGPDMNIYVEATRFDHCVNYGSTNGVLRGFRLVDVGNFQNYTVNLGGGGGGGGGGQRIDDSQ